MNPKYLFVTLLFLFGLFSCKPKKCAQYSDPQKNYKADYNKKGLVKKKNKAPTRNWGQY